MLGDQYYKYKTVIEKIHGAQSLHIDLSRRTPSICAILVSVPRHIFRPFSVHLAPFAICHACSSLASTSGSTGAKGAGTRVPLLGATMGPVPGKGSKWLVRLWIITTRWSKWNWKSQYSGVMLPLLSWCGKAVPSSLTWLWGGMCFNRLQQSKWITKRII